MQFNKRALSFFDIMLVVILLGILLYFAFQGYYKWAESFQAQEAINRLKSVKSNIELCIYKAASLEEIRGHEYHQKF
jgi:Tfp pilus assembly protein PilE